MDVCDAVGLIEGNLGLVQTAEPDQGERPHRVGNGKIGGDLDCPVEIRESVLDQLNGAV
jgi:hypothetical protein